MIQLNAMPSLCDATDFGLSNDSYNKSQAALLLKRKTLRVIEYRNDSILYRVGDTHNGCIFLYDPSTLLITYFVKLTVRRTRFHGVSVTQTSLWRAIGASGTEYITSDVIFSRLLVNYPAIMSDRIQTEDGRRFWIDLMAKALTRGFKVALIDFNKRLSTNLANHAAIRLWATEDNDSAWSWHSMKHQGLRFMIYRKEIANDLQSTQS